ncbi:MAG: Jag N-terminal domain-containing protein [Acidimicrobiia bacterium]|nr:Jag N-terminal domain-containing protein [Actinomycetota bacterium]MBL6924246.1 Jag N-terminal domain-containing protein [Acidimicrobiia bacterium]MBL6926921.1 Jag N-terminal domain-containing protein [Acidimicrobiia bacterium]
MEWIETTGTTLDEAKERALDRLGVAEDELEYEVLEEATSRMLGLKRTEARMRARVRPASPRAKNDRRDRNRRSDRSRGSGGRSGSEKSRSEGKKTSQRGDGDRDGDKQNSGSGRRRGGRSDGRSGEKKSTGGSGRDRGGKIQSEEKTAAGSGRGNREEKVDVEKMDLQTQAEITEGFLQGLLDKMGLDARVASTIDDDRLTVEAHGLNLGLAIGQGGETVRAITELSRTIIQRRSQGSAAGSLVVDVGGYRERRRSFLEDFARSQVEAVLADGQARALEPMAAADRKIVHDVVGEIDGVTTASEGSDSSRRVVILAE